MTRFAFAAAVLLAHGSMHAGNSHERPRPYLLFSASVVAADEAPHGYTPTPDIYSLSSRGRLAQLTFTGGGDPLPAPNGRLVAFTRAGDLWLMNADGRHQRLLVRRAVGAVWSPDSRRIAYTSESPSEIRGIRVIDANGAGARMLVRGNVDALAWSPDGRSLAFVRGTLAQSQPPAYELVILRNGRQRVLARASCGSASWSADGRWLAYGSCAGQVVVVHPDGSGRRVVGSGTNPIWSPHGRQLAYLQNGAIELFDERSGAHRTLVKRTPGLSGLSLSGLSWSPDGTKLAYEFVEPESELGQVETVTTAGRIRSLGSYPIIGGLAWTTPPGGTHYRPAQPVGPIAVGDELRFRLPVEELAADGDSVAYRTCGAIGVWRTATNTVTAVRSELPLCGVQDDYLQFYSLALAGNQVAWGMVEGGIGQTGSLTVASVAAHPSFTVLAGGPGETNGDPRGTARVGYLLGAGPLLAFSSWVYCDEVGNSSCWQLPAQQRPLVSQTLWRLREPAWPRTCPGTTAAQTSARCEQLRTEPGPLRPLDADPSRIVASGDNATVVLDSDGRQLLSVPVSTTAAQLAGSDLVLLVPGAVREFDATTGALLHTWPLPDVRFGGFCGLQAWVCGSPRLRLAGAAGGVIAYLLDGNLHLLRLSDGTDATVAAASAAQLDDAGLFYAYQTSGIRPGRIRFVPFSELPLR